MAQYIVGLIVKSRDFEESKTSPEIETMRKKIKQAL